MLMYTLALSCLTTSNLPWFMDLPFQVPMQYYSLQYQTLLITSHIHNWVLFLLWLCLFILSAVISKLISTGHLLTWGLHLSVSYLFTFSYCSWGSQSKNIEVVCNSLLQWTTFFQNPPPRPVHLVWPYMAWLIFIELDKAVVHVIRLVGFCDHGLNLSALWWPLSGPTILLGFLLPNIMHKNKFKID